MAWLLVRTVALAGAVALLAVPTGAVLAVLGVWCAWPGRRWVMAGLISLLFLPVFLQATAWDAALGRQGWLGQQLGWGGVPLLDGWFAAVWLHAVTALPWVVMLVSLGVRDVEPELVEQAWLDGSPFRGGWRVWWPRCRGWLALSSAWVVVLVAGDMTVTDMFQVRTLAEELYADFALDEDPLAVALRLAPGVAVVGLLVAVILSWSWRWRPLAQGVVRSRPTPVRWGGWWATLLVGGGVGMLLALPLGSLVLKLGWVAEPVAGHWERSWSPGHAAAILVHVPVEFAAEWWWTGLLSALTATLVTAGVVPLAWWARRSPARAAVGLGVAALVAAVPGPYFAVVVLAGRVRWGGPALDWLAEQTVFLPVVVLALRAVPVCGALAWQACRTVSPSMLEVAELAGGSAWRRWWQVVWPSRRRAFLAVWLCGWCLAAGDVATTILLVPPRVSTVAVRTFQLVHAGVDDRLAGLSLWTWLGYALLAWGVMCLLRRDAAREGGA